MKERILILGGYGSAGRRIAEFLLAQTDVRLVIAGRSIDKARSAAQALDRSSRGNRAAAISLDASDQSALAAAFADVSMVVVASSTTLLAESVARAALEAGIDYFDIQYSASKVRTLKALSREIAQKGCCFITDGGFHPGIPAALVRAAAGSFDRIETAHVGSVIKTDWNSLDLSASTIQEFVLEMKEFQPLCFRDGTWQRSWKNRRAFDFGGNFGRQMTTAMALDEMMSLPELYPSLRETGFFVGGFNWFVDNILMLPGMLTLAVFGQSAIRPVAALFQWGLKKFSAPPYGTLLLLEASGWRAGKRVVRTTKVAHADGYVLTAAPAVACLLQYLDGTVRKPGLWLQANVVEPARFLHDLQTMGIRVETSESTTEGG